MMMKSSFGPVKGDDWDLKLLSLKKHISLIDRHPLISSSFYYRYIIKGEKASVVGSLCFPVARSSGECDGSATSPSVTPFFFYLSWQLHAQHSTRERSPGCYHLDEASKGGKKTPAMKQIILPNWKVPWQQYAFVPITPRTKCQTIKNTGEAVLIVSSCLYISIRK